MKYNEEILANNIELLTKGAIEKGNIDTCMIFGISGNCGKNCPKFKDKTCEEYLTTLENEYNGLQQENQQLKKQKDDVVECCKNSIKSINEKLENNKEPFEVVDGKIIYLNDYQVVRLKAIRMKCKEILRMLGEIDE